jgi:hypothetical protein
MSPSRRVIVERPEAADGATGRCARSGDPASLAPRRRMHATLGALWLSLGLAHPCLADEPAATLRCDVAGRNWSIAYHPGLESHDGTEDAATVVRFWSLVDTDHPCPDDTSHSIDPCGELIDRERRLDCAIGEDRFEFVFKPGVPNVNLQGRCGGAVFGRVSVLRNGRTELEDVLFEDYDCHRRECYVHSVTWRAGDAAPRVLRSRYPDWEPDGNAPADDCR